MDNILRVLNQRANLTACDLTPPFTLPANNDFEMCLMVLGNIDS